MPETSLKLAVVVSLPFAENTYLAHLEGRADCLVIDPGLEPDKVFDFLDKHGLTPAAILNTHGHGDHIAGNGPLKRRWPDSPLVIGRNEVELLSDPVKNMSAGFGISLVSPPADVLVSEGDTYSAAGFDLEVLEIPGHSPGHVVYVWRGGQPTIVFGGDVLFAGSIGRTDFSGGSMHRLVTGIQRKLFTLPDDTLVLSGHGEPTTIGQEKRTNPFVGEPSGYREADA